MLKRTPLYEIQRELGARFTPFAGWEMAVQFTGVIAEHEAVRNSAGLFDVSHMGEILLTGKGALPAVQYLSTNDASKLQTGACQYTLLCNEAGGVVDDVILYRLGEESFLYCVNGINAEKALKWMEQAIKGRGDVTLTDKSSDYALVAIQGPASLDILGRVTEADIGSIKFYGFLLDKAAATQAIISRTGYTGEDGFELYVNPEDAVLLYRALMEAGKDKGLIPCGLASRDTLRIEMGYPLYGHELSEDITPIEAGLKRFVSFDKGDFIGREALYKEVQGTGVRARRSLIAIEMERGGVPRQGYRIFRNGEDIGIVTSGTFSPTLKKGVAMALVRDLDAKVGDVLQVEIRATLKDASVVKRPFYRKKAVV